VKICYQLVKIVENMIFQTRLRVVRFNSCKGSSLPWKRAKRKFWSQQVSFGTKFRKFGSKRANLASLVLDLQTSGKGQFVKFVFQRAIISY